MIGHHPTIVPYDTNTTVLAAAELLLNASDADPSLRNIPEFKYDIVDVTRQVLVNRFIDLYTNLIAVYNSSSSPSDVSAAGAKLVQLVDDLDELLYTNENFLLSTWIEDALQWAWEGCQFDSDYAAYLEFSARNQLTLWGPNGEINDYASKQWAGLVGEYYSQRWEIFVQHLVHLKENGLVYNDSVIAKDLLGFGREWQKSTMDQGGALGRGTTGNAFEIVRAVLQAWG